MKDDANDVLWGLYQENTLQGRHHEQLRSAVTGFFAALAAGVLSVVTVDRCVDRADVPLCLFLVATGAFGALFSAKQYERFNAHMERARVYRNELERRIPDSKILELKAEADKTAKQKFPRLNKWRLAPMWVALHLLIAAFGAVLAFGAFLNWFPCTRS